MEFLAVADYEEEKRVDPQIRQIGQIPEMIKSCSSEIC